MFTSRSMAELTGEGCGAAPGAADGQKVCRSRGGESCAFDGAMIVLQPIADAAHVVHGPIACAGNSWEGRGTVSFKGSLHHRGLTTDMTELDIVYGSREKLRAAIAEAHARFSPSAVFVHSTCVSGLIGEDMEAVAAEATRELGIPVIAVGAPGFVGPKNLGNRIAGEVLLSRVIGTEEAASLTGAEVNLIGEYNIAGDLGLVEPLLREAGITLLACMTGNASYSEIARSHRARLNVVVCGRALINVARSMRDRYGIPYIEASFFGRTGISDALRAMARGLGDRAITKRVERIVTREEAALRRALEPYAYLRGKRVVLYSGGVKSWAMVAALHDLGMRVVGVGVKKSTAEDEARVRALVEPGTEIVENVTPGRLLDLMRGADLMVAGGRNLYLGVKHGFPFVDVNQERHAAYAGYAGLVNLARDIHAAMRFHGLAPADAPQAVAVERTGGPLLVDPLRHSPALGAVMALQGVDACLPLWHGAQGCNFLGKVLLTRHFREPIAVTSTKIFAEDVVMGSDERLMATASEGIGKHAPALVAVVGTALAEVRGEDVAAVVRRIAGEHGVEALYLPTPDYTGGLESGYATAVEALCALAEPEQERNPALVNMLVGPHITPADCTALREMAGDFGLVPILLPGMDALDGTRDHMGALAVGGTSLADIRRMGSAAATIAVGASMERAARVLEERCGVGYEVIESPGSMAGADMLTQALSALACVPVPSRYARQRRVLVDALGDASFFLAARRVCLALETGHALDLSCLLAEAGASVDLCVIPEGGLDHAGRIKAHRVLVGGLADVEGAFDLMVSNSHATAHARRLGVPLMEAGFPAYKAFGRTLAHTVGYGGALASLVGMTNLMMHTEVQ